MQSMELTQLCSNRKFGIPKSPLAPMSLGFDPRDEPSYSCPLHKGTQAGPCLLSLPCDAGYSPTPWPTR